MIEEWIPKNINDNNNNKNNDNIPGNIYFFKVSNRNTRTWCDICSKLRIKTSEQRSSVSIPDVEQVNAWIIIIKMIIIIIIRIIIIIITITTIVYYTNKTKNYYYYGE